MDLYTHDIPNLGEAHSCMAVNVVNDDNAHTTDDLIYEMRPTIAFKLKSPEEIRWGISLGLIHSGTRWL